VLQSALKGELFLIRGDVAHGISVKVGPSALRPGVSVVCVCVCVCVVCLGCVCVVCVCGMSV